MSVPERWRANPAFGWAEDRGKPRRTGPPRARWSCHASRPVCGAHLCTHASTAPLGGHACPCRPRGSHLGHGSCKNLEVAEQQSSVEGVVDHPLVLVDRDVVEASRRSATPRASGSESRSPDLAPAPRIPGRLGFEGLCQCREPRGLMDGTSPLSSVIRRMRANSSIENNSRYAGKSDIFQLGEFKRRVLWGVQSCRSPLRIEAAWKP